jgi:uncharacterized membrane protein
MIIEIFCVIFVLAYLFMCVFTAALIKVKFEADLDDCWLAVAFWPIFYVGLIAYAICWRLYDYFCRILVGTQNQQSAE